MPAVKARLTMALTISGLVHVGLSGSVCDNTTTIFEGSCNAIAFVWLINNSLSNGTKPSSQLKPKDSTCCPSYVVRWYDRSGSRYPASSCQTAAPQYHRQHRLFAGWLKAWTALYVTCSWNLRQFRSSRSSYHRAHPYHGALQAFPRKHAMILLQPQQSIKLNMTSLIGVPDAY